MTVAEEVISMDANLASFVKNSGYGEDYLPKTEEISLDNHEFSKNTVTKKDWEALAGKCGNLMAFSAIDCKLSSVELPEKMEQIEVLDFSMNPISDIAFVKAFPNLVSLTIKDTKITDLAQLDHLENCAETFKVLEMSDEMLLGKESQEELRKAVFAKFPKLMGVNGIDADGKQLDDEFPEEEDELAFLDDLEALEEGDLGDFEEDEDDEVQEPDAKKQKTEEKSPEEK